MGDFDDFVLSEFQRMAKQSNPYNELRELVQNGQDSGASRLEVIAGFIPSGKNKGVPFLVYRDNGEGMTWDVLYESYTVLFNSTKEGEIDKTGKYGVGMALMFGMPWTDIVVTTTPKFGDEEGLAFLRERGAIDRDYDQFPHYRLVFENIRDELPVISTKLVPDDDLLMKEREGTNILQMFKEIKESEFEGFVESWLDVVNVWLENIPTPLYFGIATDWEVSNQGSRKNEYRVVTGDDPKFYLMNVISDGESSLDSAIARWMVPGFDGIGMEASELYHKYGFMDAASKRHFLPEMIAKYGHIEDQERKDALLDALKYLRMSEECGNSNIMTALTLKNVGIRVANKGIRLSDERFGRGLNLVNSYVDSPVINHDIAREGIVKDGERGRIYEDIVGTIESMQNTLIKRFYTGIRDGIIPLECPEVRSAAIQIIRSALRSINDQGMMGRLVDVERYGNYARQMDVYRNELEQIIGHDALDIDLFESYSGECCYSLSEVMDNVSLTGEYYLASKGVNIDLLKKLDEEGIPVLKDQKPLFARMSLVDPERRFLYIDIEGSMSYEQNEFLGSVLKKCPDRIKRAGFARLFGKQNGGYVIVQGDRVGGLYRKEGEGNRERWVEYEEKSGLFQNRQRTLIINADVCSHYMNLIGKTDPDFLADAYVKRWHKE